MKLLIIFFYGFILSQLFYGCSSNQIDPVQVDPVKDAPNFLSENEIREQMAMFSPNAIMDDAPLSNDDKNRLGNLVDEKVFFSEPIPIEEKSNFLDNSPIKDRVDLRYRDTPVKKQDNGKCTAYAGIAAIESTLNKEENSKTLDLSDWHIWSKYRKYSSSAFMEAAKSNRIADEFDWPQYGKPKNGVESRAWAKIEDSTYLGGSVDLVKKALSKGNVVYMAMSTPTDMIRCKSVISPYSGKTGGGHAIMVAGYYLDHRGNTIAIIKNSWGPNCGDNGYQYVPLTICTKNGFYCQFWEIASVNSLKGTIPLPKPTPEKVRVCKRIWYKFWIGRKCYWVTK